MDEKEFHQLLKKAESKLKNAGIESATAEVEIIMESLLNVERIDLYMHGAVLIDDHIEDRLNQIIEKRTTRYPLQYILGEIYFYGRRFFVNPYVMVPTPETEILCDLAINYIKNEGTKSPQILDVGVGSGVIAVTVACELPQASITALDISSKAIEVAQKNAADHQVAERISFKKSDIFSSLSSTDKFDLILSNPPYISENEYKTLPLEVLADPKISLVSGLEGLDFIRTLVEKAPAHLKETGRIMFEIGYDQADQIAKLTEKDRRYRSISIIKDLNDIDRVVILSL